MANVLVIQRHAHLSTEVRIEYLGDTEGRIAKATLIAISNTRWGSGESRSQKATVIRWTVWGTQAENAATYLGQGSHVNVVGRVSNSSYVKDGVTQHLLEFTAEEIDYLDSKADADARRTSGRRPSPSRDKT